MASSTLLFIDTNIFLDFYRQVGRESDLSILKHIGQHHDRIITTRQVEMEFKKHRQRVIANSLAAIKAPDWAGLKLPAYLAKSRQASGLTQGQTRIKELVKTIQKRGRKVFEKPTQYDPVYKVVQRLFTANTLYNLSRSKEKEEKKTIRLAWHRFLLGHPPRKANDTSIGDAVNWEWVVDCATQEAANVVIVSRDSDYGVNLKGNGVHINDWLAQEFKERVKRTLNVTLTDRLSEGLQRASIKVTKKEIAAEEAFLERRLVISSSQSKDLIGGAGVGYPLLQFSNNLGARLLGSEIFKLAENFADALPLSQFSNIAGAVSGSEIFKLAEIMAAGSPQRSQAGPPDDGEDND